jgi:hypothetical protein
MTSIYSNCRNVFTVLCISGRYPHTIVGHQRFGPPQSGRYLYNIKRCSSRLRSGFEQPASQYWLPTGSAASLLLYGRNLRSGCEPPASHLRANIGSLLARQLVCYSTGAACNPDSSRLRSGLEPPVIRIRAASYPDSSRMRSVFEPPAIRIRAACDPDSIRLRSRFQPPASQYGLTTGSSVLAQREISRY